MPDLAQMANTASRFLRLAGEPGPPHHRIDKTVHTLGYRAANSSVTNSPPTALKRGCQPEEKT